MAEHYVKLS